MNKDFWNERYRPDAYAYGREPNEFLREQAHRIPAGRVLCLAEGEGRNAVFLAELGYEVTAVDSSAEGLRKAQRLADEQGVKITTVEADLNDYAPPLDAFAGVVAIFAHLPATVRKKVHAWVPQVPQAKGVFILEAYRPEQLTFKTGGPRDATMLMTLEGLQAELAGLQVELGREVEREVHEGAYHTGMSATVQMVALRK